MKSTYHKMSFLILLLFLTTQQIMAQANYDALWKSVAKFENEGKTKDALSAVEKLIANARNENNTVQTVKALLYKYKYIQVLEENSELKIVVGLKQEINMAKGADKSILQSILAELYFQYYNRNAWKFSNRTATDIKPSDDFRTWDLKTLFKEINQYYIASLSEKTILQQIKLDAYTPIIEQVKGSQIFRPTLYDLLANRAISYFNDDKSNIAEPSNAFAIDDKKYFATVNDFITIQLNDADKNAQDYQALKIYQDLLRFRLSDKNNLVALADADLLRIQYVKEHYNNKEENESLYYEALLRLQKEYEKCSIGATINYEIAKYIAANATSENKILNNAAPDRNSIKEALTICDETIKKYPETEGAKNCAALRETFFHKNISITTEEAVVPKTPFKALLNYRNISTVYFKLVPLPYAKKEDILEIKNKETQDDVLKRINAIKPVKSWSITTPVATDFLEHSTEIKVDGIKQGCYVLLASTDKLFTLANGSNAVAMNTIFVSQISYTTRNNNNKEEFELYVLDRDNGHPLQNAMVKFYRNTYDYDKRKYVRTDIGTATADANGLVTKKVNKSTANKYYYNENFLFEIFYKDDFLPSEQSFYKYFYAREENLNKQKNIQLFTDRSIYRPGQIIYFKGIATQQNKEQHTLLPNEKVSITFKDVNYQDISTQQFTTNEFGSFTGTFTAPTTGLLGNMTLETNYGSTNVQIEEYKRPKFEVLFDDVKKSYNLQDQINISGKAVSYAGANIDNAEVKYTVRRVAQFPSWCWYGWRSPWFPASNEKIITNGITKTDDNGNFIIDFKAIPDLSISKEFKPYFNYEISADVVDINGETHTASTTVRVGYLAIEANLNVSDNINTSIENKISITTNNLNGQHEGTAVSIKIYELIAPQNPKKSRLWNAPDKFALTKEEHDNLFPYDVYANEDLMNNWQKGMLLNSYAFNTDTQKEIVLPSNSLKSGAYIIEFSCKDKNDNLIGFKKSFIATSSNDQTPKPATFAYFHIDKNTAKPNETVNIQIGSSMSNTKAILEIAFKGKLIDKKMITLNNEIKTIPIAIKENYIGGIEVNYVLVNKNRLYSKTTFITVPYEDKSLKIEWLTFRDKLLPGANEQWKLKITGSNKEKVTAELLATMYDASLDAFLPHSFGFYLNQSYFNGYLGGFGNDAFNSKSSLVYTSKKWNPTKEYAYHGYDDLNLFGLSIGSYYSRFLSKSGLAYNAMSMKSESAGAMLGKGSAPKDAENESDSFANEIAPPSPSVQADSAPTQAPTKPAVKNEVTPRTNLNETAFFLPQLQTDADGNILLNFQMPEALTRWNFLGLAHTKDLKSQYFTKSIVTQKELMLTPNAPRFLREGDKLEFSTKISNLSDRDLSGVADIEIYDAATMQPITRQFIQLHAGANSAITAKDFTVEKGKNIAVSWTLHVPSNIDAITYKIVAKADNFSDGEQASLIVLPNRMMVTEIMPLWVRGESKKSFTFDKLLNNKSKTLKNYKLTLEMSSQPVWYAVQALPYMMEYPYECAEQLFSRYYANSLASYIATENPKIKSIFDKWKNTDALLSNLEKNQELKAVLLEETPWVREAQNETEQKKRIALLFDLSKMADEQQRAFDKLIQMQTPNGGFTWFPGMPDNRYITQHIVAGFGHLAKLNVIDIKNKSKIDEVLQKAIAYLDARLTEDLVNIKKYDVAYLKKNHLYYDNIHALYARSFFNYSIDKKDEEAYNYFINQEKMFWLDQSLYAKGMIALTLHRNKEKASADKIVVSLKQNAINSEELGMYWKANENAGWYWYQAPVETQALLIEAFHEVAKDNNSVDEMKVWLLKQKQTTSWKSTKATAEACYALLLQGKDWIKSDKLVDVKMNKTTINPTQLNAIVEPGTAYYKVNWSGDDIKPEMAKIELKKSDKGPAFGAIYWQYFEDLDKISGATTALQLSKKLYKEINTNEGKQLISISDKTPLQVGDVIKVRIEIRTDRNLEYVHLKDMRAAGFEPINVLSQYKYQDGLGYYETTKDVATHFFMDWMNKGIYVFEYALRATLAGDFSNGITQIESMYAPEFKSHSKGERVVITTK